MMNKINKYSAVLDIELYEWSEQFLNQSIKPGEEIKSVSIKTIYKFENNEIVELSLSELSEICYKSKEITFVQKNFSKTFRSENGFNVKQIFNNVEDFEMEARHLTNLFGNIDTHHIVFEGFYKIKENHYEIYWS